MKRFAVLLLTLALAVCCTLPAFAADTIEVNEDVSVSGDYDWTRFQGQNLTLNVYNWGEYISNGSDDSVDVVAAFEKLTGIKVNYQTAESNEALYSLLKTGAGDYDVIVANIVADVIIALAPQVGKLLKKGGIFLCSGIIDDRADEVREKLVEAGWTIEETRSSEGWFSYLCR